MVESTDRVKIWNSFFKLAWTEAKSLHEASKRTTSSKSFDPPGGTLTEERYHILATMVLCNLAIEARANHLYDEMAEEGKISQSECKAVRRIPTKHKWFLLPKFAGVNKKLDDDKVPHQAVAEICGLRNNLLHVNYEGLDGQLPPPDKALSLFENFVKAMEDMNVILGRHKQQEKKVLDLGRF